MHELRIKLRFFVLRGSFLLKTKNNLGHEVNPESWTPQRLGQDHLPGRGQSKRPLLAHSGRIFHTLLNNLVSKTISTELLPSKQFLNTLSKSHKYFRPRYFWHFNDIPLQLKVLALNAKFNCHDHVETAISSKFPHCQPTNHHL